MSTDTIDTGALRERLERDPRDIYRDEVIALLDRLAALEAELADEKADRELWASRALTEQKARYAAENKAERLEAALQFYADGANWVDGPITSRGTTPNTYIDNDGGMRAQQALAGGTQ